MIHTSSDVLAAAHDHAAAQAPRECCGVVIIADTGRQEYVPCGNLSDSGEQFVLDPIDYASAADRGRVAAIVHSHVAIPCAPSMADRVGCEKSGLPWIIVQHPHRIHQEIAPTGWRAPIIGRPFLLGVLDCYTLIRDHYAAELGIDLPDVERSPGWEARGEDLYERHFRAAGFRPVPESDLRAHDVILMSIGEPCTNHGAVYLGDDVMIHHLRDRLSERTVYGGFFRKATMRVLRHHRCAG